MKSSNHIYTVESHTMGEPLRLIVSGVPNLLGSTMQEKKAYFMEHYDYLRRALILEPRGHKDMFGAVLTSPTMPDADVGVIFMHGGGYHNMCGHGTIAINTILVETGMVNVTEPITTVRMEAPAGLVTVKVTVEGGNARQVSFQNVPSFLYKRDAVIHVPDWGSISVDIAFGGSFFVIVDSRQIKMEICPDNASKLVEAGMAVIKAVNEQIEVRHPELEHIKRVDLCEIYGSAKSPDANMQNITIFDGQIDRSPCGTGTCAKVAAMWAKGELQLGQDFCYESVIGTKFVGKAIMETNVGPYRAIIPEITGSAFITGFSQFVIDENDPVRHGFYLK